MYSKMDPLTTHQGSFSASFTPQQTPFSLPIPTTELNWDNTTQYTQWSISPNPQGSQQPPPTPQGVLTSPRRARRNPHLSKDDKLTLLRIAVRRKGAWGSAGVTDGKFWTNVAGELSELTGKPPHASLGRTVSRMIVDR
jgi:hypothetical protein